MINQAISFHLDDIPCHIDFFGIPSSEKGTPLFILPAGSGAAGLIEDQHMRLDPVIESGEVPAHALAVFETKNWDDDLSPWPAPSSWRGQKSFSGFAGKTLDWIQERFLPEIIDRVPSTREAPKGLLGYSLAGLFAVWAATQTDLFSVYGSCSGSLWYDRFSDYMEKNALKAPCSIYLSLGDKEEFTRNPKFSKVGEATRRTADLLKASPLCKDMTLVWNSGGHMGAAGERLAAAQLWMKSRLQENGDAS